MRQDLLLVGFLICVCVCVCLCVCVDAIKFVVFSLCNCACVSVWRVCMCVMVQCEAAAGVGGGHELCRVPLPDLPGLRLPPPQQTPRLLATGNTCTHKQTSHWGKGQHCEVAIILFVTCIKVPAGWV